MHNYNRPYYQKLYPSHSSKFWENSARLRSVNLTQRDTWSIFILGPSRSYSRTPPLPPWISRPTDLSIGQMQMKTLPKNICQPIFVFCHGFSSHRPYQYQANVFPKSSKLFSVIFQIFCTNNISSSSLSTGPTQTLNSQSRHLILFIVLFFMKSQRLLSNLHSFIEYRMMRCMSGAIFKFWTLQQFWSEVHIWSVIMCPNWLFE